VHTQSTIANYILVYIVHDIFTDNRYLSYLIVILFYSTITIIFTPKFTRNFPSIVGKIILKIIVHILFYFFIKVWKTLTIVDRIIILYYNTIVFVSRCYKNRISFPFTYTWYLSFVI